MKNIILFYILKMWEKKVSEEQENKYRQDETSNIQKSETPDSEYMKSHALCYLCHGVASECDRSDCPQMRIL